MSHRTHRSWLLNLMLLAAVLLALLQPVGAAQAQVPCLTPVQAIGSLGQPACVEGVVTNAFYARQSNGQPTFLDMGTQFTAVIWGDDRAAFNPAPETWRGKRLRVTGVISEYRGKAQIIVREPGQLGPAGGPPPVLTPARTRTPLPPPTPVATASVTTTASAIPPTVETATAVAAATVEAELTAEATLPADEPVTATPSPAIAGATAIPTARSTTVATAVSRARVDVMEQKGGPSWLMVAGGLGLVAVGAGGALVLTRRRPRDE